MKENMQFNLDDYININIEKVNKCTTYEQFRTIMDEVIPECIKIHNDKLLNDNERTKIIGLIELIQAKEKEMRESIQLSEISDMDLKLIKNYLELLKDINKINDLLDMK